MKKMEYESYINERQYQLSVNTLLLSKRHFFMCKTLLRYREFETEYSLQSYQTGELTVVLVGPSVVSTTLTSWASVGADSAIASTFTPMDSSIISF